MSNQFENETVTPETVRQFLLSELDASQQVIASLSDEELEAIVGGVIGKVPDSGLTPAQIWEQNKQKQQDQAASAQRAEFLNKFNRSYSSPALLQGHQATPWEGPYRKDLQDYLDSFKGLGQRKDS